MGVYEYTMRAKTVQLHVLGTGFVLANLYSFAYRYTSYWKGDRGYNAYNLMTTNAQRRAEEAFYKYNQDGGNGYVIVGDLDDGKLKLEGHNVYRGVKSGSWTDTERFPGTLVGWVGVQGKSLFLSDRTPWSEGQVCDDDGTWKPYKSRSILEHGIVRHERIVDGVHTISP